MSTYVARVDIYGGGGGVSWWHTVLKVPLLDMWSITLNKHDHDACDEMSLYLRNISLVSGLDSSPEKKNYCILFDGIKNLTRTDPLYVNMWLMGDVCSKVIYIRFYKVRLKKQILCACQWVNCFNWVTPFTY